MIHALSSSVFIVFNGTNVFIFILFAITAAGVVPCGSIIMFPSGERILC